VSDHPDECGCVECLRAESYMLGEAYRLRLPPDPRKVLLAQMAATIASGMPHSWFTVGPYRKDVAQVSVSVARAILDEVGLVNE
jgi:hypothetical protein